MDDLISRQAAIDALADYIHNVDKVYSEGKLSADDCKDAAKSVLDELPSAQPEIMRCRDCKYYGRADKRRFYRGGDCTKGIISTIVPDKDFCSRGERKES